MTDFWKCHSVNILKGYASSVACTSMSVWTPPHTHTCIHTQATPVNDLLSNHCFWVNNDKWCLHESHRNLNYFQRVVISASKWQKNAKQEWGKLAMSRKSPKTGEESTQIFLWAVILPPLKCCPTPTLPQMDTEQNWQLLQQNKASVVYTVASLSLPLPLPFLHILNCI